MSEHDWLKLVHQQIQDCGLQDADYSVTYQDDLQDYAVRVSGSPTDAVLERLAAFAASSGLWLDFDRSRAWERYAMLLDQAEAPQRQAALNQLEQSARAELATLGLLHGLPIYSQDRDLADFAAQVEKHAGFEVGTTFRIEENVLTLQPMALQDFPAFKRVLLVLSASGFHNLGGHFVLSGEGGEG